MGKNENSEAWTGGQPGQSGQTGQPGQMGAENGWQVQGPQPGVMYHFVPGAGFVPVTCAPGQYNCYGPQIPPHLGQPGMGQPYMAGPGMPPPPPYGAPYGAPYGMPYGAPYGAPYGPEAHEAHHAPHAPHGHEAPYGPQGPDMGQMYGMMNDVMQGKGDPGKLLGLFQAPGGEFWKGAIVGAAAVLLFNSSAVKDTLAGVFGAMGGQKPDADCGAEAEEV